MGITFAGQKFDVRLTTEPIGNPEEGERAILGQTDEGFNTIIIDGTLPKTRQAEVLVHELVHLADMAMPESIVRTLGASLFGILSENDILRPNFMDRIVAGNVTRAQAKRVEKANDRVMSGPVASLGRSTAPQNRVSERPWSGSATGFDIEQGLPVREPDGTVNRVACHMAAAMLSGARGGVSAPMAKKRAAAQMLVRIYRQNLDETPPESLRRLARG